MDLNGFRRRLSANAGPSAINSEGPYVIADGSAWRCARSNFDLLKVVEFVANLKDDGKRLLPLDEDMRGLGIVLELVHDHLSGKVTTTSSLADASGLSYGTAIRTIADLIADGFIAKRPRTTTGRSFSLHPTAKLLESWQVYAEGIRSLANDLSQESAASFSRPRRGNTAARTVIAPPAVLRNRLALPRGVRLLVHADPTFMAMTELKRQLGLVLGTEIITRALPIDRLQQEIMANAEEPVSNYDIIACDLPWFGEMASANRLKPLDSLIESSNLDLDDFFTEAVTATRWNGKHYGIPIAATAEVLVHRLDRLAEEGIAPPHTLSELIEAARQLHRPSHDQFGIAWNGQRGTPLGHTFMTLMAAVGQPIVEMRSTDEGFDFDQANGEIARPTFHSAAARETAELLRELMQYAPPNVLSMAWYDRAMTFAEGKSALAYSHTFLANLFERDSSSPAYRKVGYAPHPTGPLGRPFCVLGGYALCIPANIAPERISPVWDAIVSLTSASSIKLYALNGSLASPRFSVNSDPEVSKLSPLVSVVDEFARQGLLKMWPRPPVPGISILIQVAGEEIHDMLRGAKTPERALADAQNRAEALLHRLKRETFGPQWMELPSLQRNGVK